MTTIPSKFMHECERAPRLNEMFSFFSATASGRSGAPKKNPAVDPRLLQFDNRLSRFAKIQQSLWGNFDPHYFSSIPYRLEEEIRLGDALLEYGISKAQVRGGPVGYYVLGAAEGTFARTLSSMATGSILTLSCSPNEENEESFYRRGRPQYSTFFLGPFHRLTSSFLSTDAILKPLAGKFDVILEDTTFQMYSSNRSAQIEFVKQYLRDDGIFLFVEKHTQPNQEEYLRRELQKDYGYKARYFSSADIDKKREAILQRMNLNEVSLENMAFAIGEHFSHACITWNSGNFYTIAASNDADNLHALVGNMCEPCIPNEYVYEELPAALPGSPTGLPVFRQSSRRSR
ncbi:MAG: class I SAM-dependent methyltransferase [Brucella intermedia]